MSDADRDARGSCMCGAVRYRVRGRLRDVWNCHCERCRRFTGHHLAASAAETDRLEISDETGSLTWFAPVPEVSYGFCGRCGSSLFWRSQATPERTSICAGTLDLPTNLVTAKAWWTSAASDYHVRPMVEEFPTEG